MVWLSIFLYDYFESELIVANSMTYVWQLACQSISEYPKNCIFIFIGFLFYLEISQTFDKHCLLVCFFSCPDPFRHAVDKVSNCSSNPLFLIFFFWQVFIFWQPTFVQTKKSIYHFVFAMCKQPELNAITSALLVHLLNELNYYHVFIW